MTPRRLTYHGYLLAAATLLCACANLIAFAIYGSLLSAALFFVTLICLAVTLTCLATLRRMQK